MSKVKKIIEFVIALLNFLFHFKPSPDEKNPVIVSPLPLPAPPDTETWNKPLFETVH